MTVVGIVLAALGCGDLVAGLSGRPEASPRARVAIAVAALVGLTVAMLTGMRALAAVLLAILTGVAEAAWAGARSPIPWTPRRAAVTLWAMAAGLALVIATAGVWPSPQGGALGDWLDDLPFPALANQSPARVVLALGAGLWLTASANALVRLLLAAVGTDAPEAEQTLRGGRIIGPMERIVILGFLIAGQATAAALVVSAKSLLRFPEMRSDQKRIDLLTEYFLVGSFASWILALLPAPLLGAG